MELEEIDSKIKEDVDENYNYDDKLSSFKESRIIVKNLPENINEETLENILHEIDPFLKIEDTRVVRDRMGLSRGFAFMDFISAEKANDAVNVLHGRTVEGKILSCALSRPPSSGENDRRTIFVNNIPRTTTEETIRSNFSKVRF